MWNTVHLSALKDGSSKSCGCYKRDVATGRAPANKTHGLSRSPIRIAWLSMKNRCYSPRDKDWPRYGGRGITVCDRWRDSLENFAADMGPRPAGYSLERVDGDGNYEPTNCIWADPKTQARNRHTNQKITWRGETKTVMEWAEATGIGAPALYWRLHAGWDPERILTAGTAKLLTYNGQTRTVTEWAKALGLKAGTIYYRLEHGLPVDQVLSIQRRVG